MRICYKSRVCSDSFNFIFLKFYDVNILQSFKKVDFLILLNTLWDFSYELATGKFDSGEKIKMTLIIHKIMNFLKLFNLNFKIWIKNLNHSSRENKVVWICNVLIWYTGWSIKDAYHIFMLIFFVFTNSDFWKIYILYIVLQEFSAKLK